MKQKKICCGLVSMLLFLSMVFTPTVNAYAASGSRTVIASGKMSVTLQVGQTKESSEVSIKISGLPSNAVITKLEVNTGTLSYKGAIVTNYLSISSSNGRKEQITWGGAANKTLKTTKFLSSKANGTYTLSFNSTCYSGPFVGGKLLNVGTKTYSNPSIKIYWDDTF